MKIQTLEYFIALAGSRTINEAAQKLYVAQPTLTKSLQLFEKELGVQLFHRTKSGITLTAKGEQILPEAVKMVRYYNGWLQLAEPDTLHSLRLYTHISLAGFLLPDILLHFRETYPQLDIQYFATANPEEQLSFDPSNPVLSLALHTRASYDYYTKLQGNPPIILAKGAYGCLVSKDSPLAGRESVTFADLKTYFLLLPTVDMSTKNTFAEGGALHDIIEEVNQRQIIYVESTRNVIDMIQTHPRTYALSYYPALLRYEGVQEQNLVYLPFSDYDARMLLCLCYSSQACQHHPLLQEMVRDIKAANDKFMRDHLV